MDGRAKIKKIKKKISRIRDNLNNKYKPYFLGVGVGGGGGEVWCGGRGWWRGWEEKNITLSFMQVSWFVALDKRRIQKKIFYTLSHDSCGVLWFHVGCPCVRPSVIHIFISGQ